MASWPTTLPSPRGVGYAISPLEQVIHTDMEGGNTRSRRRTTAWLDKLACSVIFTSNSDFTTFRAWFDNPVEANGGAAWFTISLSMGTGSGIVTVSARFTSVWSARMVGPGMWEVSMNFEVRYA